MGLTGLAMLFAGAKWSVESFKSNDIVEFPIIDKLKEFEIIKSGLYAVCIVGGFYVHNLAGFKTSIFNIHNQKQIDLKEPNLKFRFRKKWKVGIEHLHFRIIEAGRYKIEIQLPEKLTVKESMLTTKQPFQSSQPIENIEVLIKGIVPLGKKILGIVFLVLGVNLSVWGILLSIIPKLFG